MTKSRVAVVKTAPASVFADIRRAMELAGLKSAFQSGARTILKDNISWHLHFPAANTTPWQLEGAILALREAGFDDLIAIHNNTVVNNPVRGNRLNRLDGVYEKYRIPALYNYKRGDITWEEYHPKRDTPALRRVYHHHIHIPREFQGTNIIHLPTVKCHIYTTTTGAMKNAFGGLLNTRRHYTHSLIHRTLVDLLIVQKEIHAGIFALMDGTFAGDGPGPRTMRPVRMDVMLASADQVAIDAVAAKLMGFDPLGIEYIATAHSEGLGCGNPREIELVGDDISGMDYHFTVGDNLASMAGDVLWFSPLRAIQKLFFHTPLVNLFILASYLYHDYIWYPFHSKCPLKQFRQSPWGRLFEERYGRNGSIHNETVRL